MDVLRTPDARFANLPDFGFAPHYQEIRDADGTKLRVHYLDEGPRNAAPVLLMHGEPSWCYLYRKIAPALAAKGHRVIAPDLIGFGRSDKITPRTEYTYERHVAWMSAWFKSLDLSGVTLFCQDWGGLIGLRLVAAFADKFARVVIANTGLPTGSGATDAFKQWVQLSQTVPEFPAGAIVAMGTVRKLSAAEQAAYDAPYPEEKYKEGARQFPLLVPVTPEHASVAENKRAWEVFERFEKPVLTAFSDSDPISKGGEAPWQSRVPGAKGQPHTVIANAGHFLQEDKPEEIAELIDTFIRRTK